MKFALADEKYIDKIDLTLRIVPAE